jgi:hypothetical protein
MRVPSSGRLQNLSVGVTEWVLRLVKPTIPPHLRGTRPPQPYMSQTYLDNYEIERKNEMKMTVKELREILAKLPDEALVFARNRDCINLDMVDVVGIDKIDRWFNGGVKFHPLMKDVYGGGDVSEIKHAIIFCDCD